MLVYVTLGLDAEVLQKLLMRKDVLMGKNTLCDGLHAALNQPAVL